jgi:tol-pal system protein YbgF
MMRTTIALAVAAALFVFDAAAVGAASPEKGPAATPETSTSRETVVDLLLQIQSLQDEIRNLRGQVEVQTYELEKLKTRQRDLMTDLDRRVRDIERRGGVVAPVPGVEPSVSATGAPAAMPAPAVAPASATVSASGSEQQDYDSAFALMKQGFYERGAKAFREFVARYPRSALAGNAQYWVGEASYYIRNFRVALEEFSKVVHDYPASQKVPDALLKVGYSHYELGDWAKARETLNRVIKQYPNTSVSKSAEGRLSLMKKEGH